MVRWFSKSNILLITVFFTVFALHQKQSFGQCSASPNAIGGFVPNKTCADVTVTLSTFSHTIPGNIPAGSVYTVDWDDGTIDTYTTVADDEDLTGHFVHTYSAAVDACAYEPVFTISNACGSDQISGTVNVWDTEQLFLAVSADGQVCENYAITWNFTDESAWNCFAPAFGDANDGDRTIRWDYGTAGTTLTTQLDNITIGGTTYNNGDFPVKGTPTAQATSGSASLDITLPAAVTVEGQAGNVFEVTMNLWNDCNPYDDPGIPGPPADAVNGDNAPKSITCYIIVLDAPLAPVASDKDFCYDGIGNLSATGTTGVLKWYDDALLTNQVGSGTSFAHGETTSGTYTYYVTETIGNNCEGPATTVNMVIRDELTVTGSISGSSEICPEETGLTYSVPNDPGVQGNGGATEYVWSVPSGFSITGGQGTKSITVDVDAGTVSVGNNTISVVRKYSDDSPSCNSPAKTITVTVNPYPAAEIYYDASYCAGMPLKLKFKNLSGVGSNFDIDYSTTGDAVVAGTANDISVSGETFQIAYGAAEHPGNGTQTTYTIVEIRDQDANGCISNISDPNSAGKISGSATATFRKDLNTEAEALTGITGPNPVCQDVDGYQYSVVPYQDPPAKPVGTYDGITRYYWWERGFSRSGSRYNKDVTFNADNTARTNGYVYVRWEYKTAANVYSSNSYKRCKSDWVRIYPITVNKKPTATITSSDFTICDGDDADINITFTGQNANGPWDLDYKLNGVVQATISGINSANYTLTIPAASLNTGDNTIELTNVSEASGAPANCPNTISGETITVTNNALPTAQITSGDATVCEGSDVDFTIDLSGQISSDWTFSYTVDGDSFNNIDTDDDPATITIPGSYINTAGGTEDITLTAISQTSGISCVGSIVGSAATLTIDAKPTTSTVGIDQDLCTGPPSNDLVSAGLGGVVPVTGTGQWIADVGNPFVATITDDLDNNTTVSIANATQAGVYNFTWEITNGVCDASEATIKVDFGASPTLPDADNGSAYNAAYCMPDLSLHANTPVVGTGIWSFTSVGTGNATFDDENDPNATVTVDLEDDYSLIWTISSGTCDSNNDTAKIHFNDDPNLDSINVQATALCEDISGGGTVANVNLTDYEGTIYAGLHTFNYYTDAGMTTLVPDETNVTVLNSSKYYVSVTDGVTGCSSPANITYTVNSLPTASVGNDAEICNGETTPISIAFTGAAPWNFDFTDGVASSSRTASSSPYSFTASPTADSVYEVTALTDNNGCTGTDITTTASVTVHPLPTAKIEDTTTICFGDNTDLTITYTGTQPFNVTYEDDTEDFAINNEFSATSTINVAPDSTNEYSLLTISDANCTGSILADSVAVVNITDLPTATTIGTAELCEGDNTDISFIFTGTSPWTFTYNDGTDDSTLTVANDTLTINETFGTDGSYTYQVTAVSDGACSGTDFGSSATITVNPLPTATLSGTTTICDGESATLSVALTGNGPWNLSWSDGSVTTPVVGINSSPYTFSVDPTSTTTYSLIGVSDSKCTGSVSGTATVTVNPLPAASITTGDMAICTGDDTTIVFDISDAVGTSWDIDYKRNGTAQVQISTSSDPYNLVSSTAGDYTITRIENNVGCVQTSFADTVTLVVNNLPDGTLSGDAQICAGTSTDVTMELSGAKNWNVTYNNGESDVSIVVDTSDYVFTVNPTADSLYTFVSIVDSNGCSASAMLGNAEITVKPVPDAPTLTTGDTSVCVAEDEATYRITNTPGNLYSWYIPQAFFDAGGSHDIGGGINTSNYFLGLIYGNDPFTDTLKIIQSKDGCVSDTLMVTLEAIDIPIADAGNDTIICEGEVVTLGGSPTATNGSGSYLYDWLPASSLDNNKISNPNATPLVTTEYSVTVEDQNGGCESLETDLSKMSVTVNAIPDPPDVASQTICFGEATPDLVATTGSGVEWFTDSGLTMKVNNGNTFVTGETVVGVYTYYVTSTVLSCQSEATIVQLTINPIPSAPTTSDYTICFGETTPDLEADGDNITWYNDFALSDVKGSGNNLATGETAAGDYSYYATQTVLGCESDGSESNLTIYAIPTAPVAESDTICNGDDPAVLSAIGTSINWYYPGPTQNVGNDNNYTPTVTAVGTYDHYVSQTINGCESSKTTVNYTINSIPTIVSLSTTDESGCSTEDGTISIVASGFAPLNYSINNGLTFETTGNYSDLANGSYPVKVKNGYGCIVGDSSLVISSNGAPSQGPDLLTDNEIDYCVGDSLIAMQVERFDTSLNSDIYWYTSPSLTPIIGSGKTLTPQDVVGTTVYYVTESLDTCESPPTTVTVNIYEVPDPPEVFNQTKCEGETVHTLTIVGTNPKWYETLDLNPAIDLDQNHTFTAINPGTTTFYVTQEENGCVSSSASISLTIYDVPDAPIPVDDQVEVCFGDAVPDVQATGSNIIWYGNVLLTDTLHYGSSYTTGEVAAGTNETYYVTQTINGCESTYDIVSLEIYEVPDPPTISAVEFCQGSGSSVLTAVGASNVNWYSDAALTNLLQPTSDTYDPGETAVGNYQYYATQTESTCTSDPAIATLTINEVPSKPVVNNDTICYGEDNPALTASGDNVKWYYPNMSTKVGEGNNYTSLFSTAGEYTYYVTQTSDDGCASLDTSMVFVIKESPQITNVVDSNQTACNSNDGAIWVTAVTASANPLEYSFDGGTNWQADNYIRLIGNGNYPVIVRNTVSCTDDWGNVQITDGSNVQSPITAQNFTYCDGETIDDLVVYSSYGAADSISWYDDPGLTNIVAIGQTHSPPNIIGENVYFAVENRGGCQSPSTNDTVRIYAIPSAPLADDVDACVGTAIPNLEATGTDIKWYSDDPGTPLVYSGSSFPHGQVAEDSYTYYVNQTIDGCTSDFETVILEINPVPDAPTASDEEICHDEATPDLVATGTNIKWYSDSDLSTLVHEGSTFATGITAIGQTTFYTTQTTSCTSDITPVTLTVYEIPSAPTVEDETVCEGESVPYLTASGQTVQWYDDSGPTNKLWDGNIYATGQTAPNVYDYYVTQTVNGCESPESAVTLTIYATPATLVITDQQACSNVDIPDMTTTGTNVKWYYDEYLNALLDTGQVFSTGMTQAGTYTYYATQTINGCRSASTSATLTIFNIPVIISENSTNETICGAEDGTISITATGTGLQYSIDGGTTWDAVSDFSPLAAGVYPLAIIDVNNCQVNGSDAVITSAGAPPGPTAAGYTVCEEDVSGSPQSITAVGSEGGSIQWYNDPDLNDPRDPGATLNPDFVTGTSTYYVTESHNGCEGAATSVEVTINPRPVKPTVADETACGNDVIPTLQASGENVIWYNASNLSNAVNTGNTYSTGLTAEGTYTYAVTQTSEYGCTSDTATIKLFIGHVPSDLTADDTTLCFGEPAGTLNTTADNVSNTVNWYGDQDLSQLLLSDSENYQPSVTNVGEYNFYATQTENGCTSSATKFTYTINDVPSAPVANDVTVCSDETVPSLYASGSNVKWYEISDPNTVVSYLNNFNTNQSSSGTYQYTVTQSLLNCTSQATTVTLTIQPETPVPSVSDTNICFGNDPIATVAGDSIRWYSNPGLTNLLESGNEYNTGVSSTGYYSYFVTQTQNNCQSNYAIKGLYYDALPNITSQVSTDQSTCSTNDGSITISATGIGTIEYSIDGGTTLNPPNDGSFTGLGTGSYQVYVQHSNGCSVNGSEIQISAGDSPLSPDVDDDQSVCYGVSFDIVNASSNNSGTTGILWYDDQAMTNQVNNGTSFNPNPDYTLISDTTQVYYVVDTIGGCISAPTTFQLTVKPLPNLHTISGDGEYCEGEEGYTVQLLSSNKNVNYQLYSHFGADSTAIGAPLPGFSNGDPVDFGKKQAGTYSVYATSTNTGCAQSMTGTTTIIQNSPPTKYFVTGGGTNCFGEGGVAVGLNNSEANVTYSLYLDDGSLVTTGNGTGGINFGNVTESGIYTVSAENDNTGCSIDMNGSASVTIYDLPQKFNIYGTNSYCDGDIGVEVGLSSSEQGISYRLYKNTTQFISSKSGTGQSLNFSYQTEGNYIIIGQSAYGCVDTMSGTAVITKNSLPTAFVLNYAGASSYCEGGNGVELVLDNSENGFEYQLQLNNDPVGNPVNGTGSAISFGLHTAGIYTSIGTDQSTGCINNMLGNPTIYTDALPIAYTVEGGGDYCEGSATGVTIQLSGSQSNTTYQFILGGTDIVATDDVVPISQSFTTAGVYTIHAINSDGCEQDMLEFATITENPLPQDLAVSVDNNGIFCDGSDVEIWLENTENNVKYELLFAGSAVVGTVVGDGGQKSFDKFSTPGSYTVRATNNATGCQQYLTDVITLEKLSLPNANPTGFTTSDCSPFAVAFSYIEDNTPGLPDISAYNWHFGDGTDSITTAPNITHTYVNNTDFLGTPDFELILTGDNGCERSITPTIEVYPNYHARFKVLQDEGCSPFTLEIVNNSSGGGTPSYNWDWGQGTASGSLPNIQMYCEAARDTSFDLTLTVTSLEYNCTDDSTMTIMVHQTPIPDFSVSPSSGTLTAPDDITLTNLTSETLNPGGWNYTWEFGDGGSSTEENPVYSYSWAGIWYISLTAYNDYCSVTTDPPTQYVINAREPIINDLNDTAGCAPFFASFPDPTQYAKSILWEFGDGNTSNAFTAHHVFEQAGVYPVRVTAKAPDVYGDSIQTTRTVSNVTVNANPYAEFLIKEYFVFILTDSAFFLNLAEQGQDYLWEFGDGETSDEFSPYHVYAEEGNYDITLYVENEFGCRDSITKGTVEASKSETLSFPTVFFPVDGGEPDNTITNERRTSVFYPLIGVGISDEGYEFSIYNRWGELVFQTQELNKGWTGYKEGILLKQGVYVYIVTGRKENGDPFQQKGNITLLR